eukprot:Pgem_evm1s8819
MVIKVCNTTFQSNDLIMPMLKQNSMNNERINNNNNPLSIKNKHDTFNTDCKPSLLTLIKQSNDTNRTNCTMKLLPNVPKILLNYAKCPRHPQADFSIEGREGTEVVRKD